MALHTPKKELICIGMQVSFHLTLMSSCGTQCTSVTGTTVSDNIQKTNLFKTNAIHYAFLKSMIVEYSGTQKCARGWGLWKTTILLRICKFITLAYDQLHSTKPMHETKKYQLKSSTVALLIFALCLNKQYA